MLSVFHRRLVEASIAAATLLLAPGAHARTPASERYSGKSSQGMPVSLALAGDRRSIVALSIGYRDRCSDGHSYRGYTRVRGIALVGGSFSAPGTYLDGRTEDRFTVAGTVARRSAHGHFALRVSGVDSAGHKVRCSTGRLTWTARRRGH